jgi:hypothetical protein
MHNVITALLIVSAIAGAFAQSGVDGKWAFEMSSPMGSVTAQVELKAEGNKLTGQFDMGGGRVWPVENGTIDGETVAFTINRDDRMTYEMKGTLSGDRIAGVAGAMGTTVDWVMTRAK